MCSRQIDNNKAKSKLGTRGDKMNTYRKEHAAERRSKQVLKTERRLKRSSDRNTIVTCVRQKED